jgi:hypothetical protein
MIQTRKRTTPPLRLGPGSRRGLSLAIVNRKAYGRPFCALQVREDTGHWRQIANIAVDDAEQRDDRGLVGGDVVEIAHGGLTLLQILKPAHVSSPASERRARSPR